MLMIGCWESIVVEICHWRASSRLFIPIGCNVLALLIKWASLCAICLAFMSLHVNEDDDGQFQRLVSDWSIGHIDVLDK